MVPNKYIYHQIYCEIYLHNIPILCYKNGYIFLKIWSNLGYVDLEKT
jgi:hypothetical protein